MIEGILVGLGWIAIVLTIAFLLLFLSSIRLNFWSKGSPVAGVKKDKLCSLGIHTDIIWYTGTNHWTCQKFGCRVSTIPDTLPTILNLTTGRMESESERDNL